MESIKQVSIKNETYYFFNDIIKIISYKSNLLKTEEKLYENIDIYYIEYITIKDNGDYEFFSYILFQ